MRVGNLVATCLLTGARCCPVQYCGDWSLRVAAMSPLLVVCQLHPLMGMFSVIAVWVVVGPLSSFSVLVKESRK